MIWDKICYLASFWILFVAIFYFLTIRKECADKSGVLLRGWSSYHCYKIEKIL